MESASPATGLNDTAVAPGDSPPRPPMVFRIGVVGHRPNRLAKADLGILTKTIHGCLAIVKEEVAAVHEATRELYTKHPPVIRAISPLAEGTDRIFADQALGLNFELCCVMPFAQTEFEKDFLPGKTDDKKSLSEFRRLRDQARVRYELDGSRSDDGGAYGTGGLVVLNQSDLLVVVWDGERKGKKGGTEETMDLARQRGLPVLWIDAQAPHHWQMLETKTPLPENANDLRVSPARDSDKKQLRKSVRGALEVPKFSQPSAESKSVNQEADDPQKNLDLFYHEHKPVRNLGVVWKAFRDILGDGKFPAVSIKIEPFEEEVKRDWSAEPTTPLGQTVNFLRPFYAWPDKLASLYADWHRSTFISAFLLSAFAVGMALIPADALVSPQHDVIVRVPTVLELLAIALLLTLVLVGRYKRWHERWLDYRLTAELIRHIRLVSPLGGARPFPQIQAHLATYGQPGSTWMAWYTRAVERAIGLPTTLVDKAQLEACLSHLADLLSEQVRYHKTNARRCHLIEKRLHLSSIALLIFTVICCGIHLFCSKNPMFPDWFDKLEKLWPFCCGFFPAVGAALAGINNQGEFRRVARRSEAMLAQLERLLKSIEDLKTEIAHPHHPGKQYSRHAVALADDAARLLINEVLDWRVVLLDRPLTPPA